MKHIFKPAFSLFAVAAITTALLSLVRDVTLEPIEIQRKAVHERTMRELLDAAEFTELPAPKTGSIVRVFEGAG